MSDRSVAYALLVLLLVVLHLLFHLALGWSGAPELITVAALLAARRLSAQWAAALGLLLGLLQDSLTLNGFGASGAVLALLCLIGARSRDLFEGESLLFVALYLFLGKWARDAGVYVLGQSARTDLVQGLAIHAPLEAVYAAITGAVALAAFRSTRSSRG